ncbi:DUF2303 family protein [Lentzea sp. NPDC102401]|uniref:DUF2303 family protein n=1 Tax=Lentzea sp. NPDC102401 TaxID=3364128 RepID=UPI0038003DFE
MSTEPTSEPTTELGVVATPMTAENVDIFRKLTVDPRDIASDASFIAERMRSDESVRVVDLEQHLLNPRRPRGTVAVNDPADFGQLVNRLADIDHSTMWADVNGNKVTAVFDDHATASVAGWRQHTAQLALKVDPDWQRWLEFNDKLGDQEWFADFLENVAHTVVEPDAATMYEIATTFRASVGSNYSGGIKRQSGDTSFTYKQETDARAGASGELEIPTVFTVRLAPWLGVDAVNVTARLRYRLNNGNLRIGYALLRPDRVKEEAFALVLQRLRADVHAYVPLFKGTAPAALAAASQ